MDNENNERQATIEEARALDQVRNMFTPGKDATGVNRSTDQVANAMRRYVEDGEITSDEHAVLVWFFHHCKVEKGLTSFDDFGKLINYSGSTVSRLFAGKYQGSLADTIKAVAGYRHIDAERQKMASATFIETSIWEKVRAVCDIAITYNAPVRIVGPSQIGKTHALMEYKRRAACTVFYCRVPSAPTFRNFQDALADACGINSSLRSEEIRARLPKALGRQTLLVVDELHELALSGGKGTAMKCMEWLREIWDVSHCGLAVCGTRSMEEDLIYSVGLKGWLEQFDQRCIRKLVLPMQLPASDVALAAAAYGLPKPDGSVESLLQTLRMNRLCTVLGMTATAARKRGETPSWDLFKRVYNHNFGG